MRFILAGYALETKNLSEPLGALFNSIDATAGAYKSGITY